MTAAPHALPPGFRFATPEVIYTDRALVVAGPEEVALLKREAATTPRRRCRLCAHPDPAAADHAMLIAMRGEGYVRPHRHLGRSETLTVIGLTMGGTLFFYVFTNYMQKFLVNTVGLTKGESTLVSAGSLFIFMLLQPVMGALSDRIGRRPMLITFGVIALFTTLPLLKALEATNDAWVAFALVMTGLFISSFYSSISAVVKAELFPVEIRALGVGLPYAIAVSLFGGTAEYIALWFKSIGHESLFYWYVTGCVFISLLVYTFMNETQKTSKI